MESAFAGTWGLDSRVVAVLLRSSALTDSYLHPCTGTGL